MDYEDLLEKIGSFGIYQKRISILLLLSIVPSALTILMFAYIQFPSNFYCSEYEIQPQNFSGNILWNQSFYEKQNSSNQCSEDHENATTLTQQKCIFEDQNTAVAEYELVCGNAWKVPITVSLYMAGVLLAQFCAKLADRFGRRPVILTFVFMQHIMAGIVGCSWNFMSYAAFVFLTGMAQLVSYVCTFVLATELMGVKRKTEIGTMCATAFSVGYVISPLFGYLFPYWRWYLWASGCVAVVHIPLIWLLPESLRWLIVSGRMNEAKMLAKKIAKVNGNNVDIETLFQDLSTEKDEKQFLENESERKKESSYFHMMKNLTMLIRSCVMYLTSFLISTIYFGISLNPSQLSGNRLVNIFLSGLVEFPALLTTYFILQRLGRSRSLSLCLIIGGLSCSVAPFFRESQPIITNIFVLLGKFTISGAFLVMYVVIGEITPTLVRSTSLGVASACARLGGVVMPFLFYAGQESSEQYVPMLLMGGMALLGGCLYLRFIPETRRVPMPDSVQDAVKNNRIYGIRLCREFNKDKIKKENPLIA